MKKINLLTALLLSILILSACSSNNEDSEPEERAAPVFVQKASESLKLQKNVQYPATVSANSEARLSPQLSGLVSEFSLSVGDEVRAGQVLAQINEIGTMQVLPNQINSGQIRQAIIAVEQAQEAYELARVNYENSLISATKDLRQAEIARDQAMSGLDNLELTFEESLKSAELAYEAAKVASEQAKASLENREKQLIQAKNNLEDNIALMISTVFNTANSIITGINNVTGFDKNNTVNISYRNNLGALDSGSYNQAELAYQRSKKTYDQFWSNTNENSIEKLVQAIEVLNEVKDLTDKLKFLFDNSISSANLPQSSSVGVSLSALQSTASSYQSQVNNVLSQAKGLKHSWENLILDNEAILDSLRQGYVLAKKQEDSAAQNLNNLKAGNISQQSQASFSLSMAENQYENLKIKLNSQTLAAKTQMDSAKSQYDNASIALQSLYDARSIVSPISGSLVQKLVNNGDTVNPGQLVGVVSSLDGIRLKFFVEPENTMFLYPGMDVTVVDAEGREYAAIISSIAAQADSLTKRFQVEASLSENRLLLLGTVVDVKISLSRELSLSNGSIFLPLSVLEIGQSGNFIFVADNNRAKRVPVEIMSVIGEQAQLRLDSLEDYLIIVEGHKFLTDGQLVEIVSR